MKNKMKFLACTFACLGVVSPFAAATPMLAQGAVNEANFNVAQNIFDADRSGSLSVGDLVYGIFNVTRIASGGSTVWNANNVPGPGVDSLSGYYLGAVTAINSLPAPFAASVSLGAASFDPNGVFSASALAAGTTAELFVDNGTPYQAGISQAADIAAATDGALWASLGITSGYWDNVLLTNGVIYGGGGFNLLANNTGNAFSPQTNPACSPTCPPTDFVFNTVASDNGSGQVWRYAGGNTGTLATVPEPAAPLLMLAGLLGWMASRRNGRKAG